MKATPLRRVRTAEQARQHAIDWQIWASNQNLSYLELQEYALYFTELAKEFDLIDEFKENGII